MQVSTFSPNQRAKVLVVEDAPIMQVHLMKLIKERCHLEVVALVESGDEAMHWFTDLKPDVVILDLMLSQGSGLDVLQRIKLRTPACRVIVFTSFDLDAIRNRCLEKGADAFLSKNTQSDALARLLDSLGSHEAADFGRTVNAGGFGREPAAGTTRDNLGSAPL